MATYTNRHKRQNLVRALCHRFVREKMPRAYALFLAEAERQYRDKRPDLTQEGRAACAGKEIHAR